MTRLQRLKDVRAKRIVRVRDYGFSVLINKQRKDIYSAAYSEQNIREKGLLVYAGIKLGSKDSGLLYEISKDKIDKLEKKFKSNFKQAYGFGNSKLTDAKGIKLNLAKPNYEKQIDSLVKHNLKYVKDLEADQRKAIIDFLKKGFKEGKSYKQIAQQMADNIKGMTLNRAKVIASTEMNRAVADSMIRTLKFNKIEKYLYVTAGDNRVSDICNINSYGNKYGRGNHLIHDVGKGPVPVTNSHINCRCVIVSASTKA